MKIIERAVLGLSASIALTAVILLSLDVYKTSQKTARLEASLETDLQSTDPSDKNSADNENNSPSIDTKENTSTYQAQENTGQISGSSTQQSFKTRQPAGQAYAAVRQNDTGADAQDDAGTDEPDSHSEITVTLQKKSTAASRNKTADSSDSTEQGSTAGSSANTTEKNSSAGSSADSAGKNSSAGSSASKNTQNSASSADKSFHTVTEDYFRDAVFIGDSRTVGMQQSGLLPQAAYYAKTGIGISEILTKRIVNEGGTMISVKDALARHSFKKVYIMIGINDMSAGDADWFKKQYKKLLQTVRASQPDAVIYIQGNIPMSSSTQDLTGSLNNKNLARRNEISRTLADDQNIFYLDIGHIYADADGNLASAYTRDGLHVTTKYYYLWADYLMHHAVIP